MRFAAAAVSLKVESGYLLWKPQHSNRKAMNLQMKLIRNTLTAFTAMLLMGLVVPVQQAHAVTGWGIGASYEIRDADPGNGFGLRLERGILSSVPLLDFKMRAHFSFFSEDVGSYRDIGPPSELSVFDYGLAVTGGIGFGLLHPYAGVGLGRNASGPIRMNPFWISVRTASTGICTVGSVSRSCHCSAPSSNTASPG